MKRIARIAVGVLALAITASPVTAQQLLLQIPPVSPTIADSAAPKERPSRTSPRYAAVLMDAHTGEILYANGFRELRHPASITKVMTLYLTFDALASGNLKLTDPVVFSRNAAHQRPSKLGIAPGKSITVDEAIRVIAVKSANDVAVALAETVGGSEEAFVQLMNRKARLLGMRDTVYANPSGLPDPNNITTAYDLALLSSALMRVHPARYAYFSQRTFAYGKQSFTNHNHLLGKVDGMDGIKTGYTVDAGFTLAASAARENRRLIAVVLGEPSSAARNRDVTALLEAGFTVLKERGNGIRLAVTDALPVAQHPAFRSGPVIEQGSNDDEKAVTHSRKAKAKPRHAAKAKKGSAR